MDYDGRVFRINQAFSLKTGAWENLRQALHGTYADSVWDHLAGAVSEPFAAGDRSRIAVKVIDERGHGSMVVWAPAEVQPER